MKYPTQEKCNSSSFPTSEGVYFLGTGLEDASVAYLTKLTTGLKPPISTPSCEAPACDTDADCSGICITDSCVCSEHSIALPPCTDIDCDLRRFVPQSGTGVGTYVISIATPEGTQSKFSRISPKSLNR